MKEPKFSESSQLWSHPSYLNDAWAGTGLQSTLPHTRTINRAHVRVLQAKTGESPSSPPSQGWRVCLLSWRSGETPPPLAPAARMESAGCRGDVGLLLITHAEPGSERALEAEEKGAGGGGKSQARK